MLYSIAKYFLKLVAAFFFQEVDRIGEHHTPISGPLIICGNHSNQFCDAILILSQCKRETSFLTAETSYKKRIIGFFARMLHAIPVKRPQDYAFMGTGQVSCDNGKVQGVNTRFTQELHPGDSFKSQSHMFVVKSVESDNELTVSNKDTQILLSPFKVFPKIDQSVIYETVHDQLKRGKCVGIFPEGGSHDRTTPLPLKAGVCLMALGAMARHNITVTIQCIGLNYYQGHRFRSKAVINFGVPYTIPRELATLYLQDRNKAVEILLKQIETRLKEVWVTAPSYEELNHIFMARRIARPDNARDDPSKTMDMNLKFAKGFRYIKEKYPDCEEMERGIKLVTEYSKNLKLYGLNDAAVRKSDIRKSKFVFSTFLTFFRIIVSICLVLDIQSLPSWILVATLGSIIFKLAEKERVKALASSSVKIHGYDVLASYKIVYGFAIFTSFSILLSVCVFFYSACKAYLDLFNSYSDAFSILFTFLFIWPLYLYFSIILSDKAMQNFTKLYVRAVSICSPKAINLIKNQREEIREIVRGLMKKFGPEIFPSMKVKKPAKKPVEFGQSINEAFGLLSEIGFS